MKYSKSQLRETLIRRRSGIDGKIVEEKSRKIAQKLINSDLFGNLRRVSAYLAVNGEVNTKLIINYLVEAGVNVCLPKYLSKTKSYGLVRLTTWGDLEEGPYKILQPMGDTIIGPKDIDLAFIPGVAFDKEGYRLGYGKGVFDRLFAKSKAVRVGLAYEFQMVDKLPQERHDLVMDFVVSEEKIYRFN